MVGISKYSWLAPQKSRLRCLTTLHSFLHRHSLHTMVRNPDTSEAATCGYDLALVAGGVAVKHGVVALPLPASLCHPRSCSAACSSGTCR